MQKVTDKLYNWASITDEGTVQQAARTSRMPFVDRVALMPDAHVGMGATVGSVIGTRDAIMPAAVGVDIGCGMIAQELDLDAAGLPLDLDKFMPEVERAIPAGVGQGHDNAHQQSYRWYEANKDRFTTDLDSKLVAKLLSQYGSLGSGNHFFEICLDERDRVWFVLHSGSRGIGNILASRHIKTAKQLMAEKKVKLEDSDLAYFEDGEDEFVAYIGDMLACQDYALANREQMMASVLRAFDRFMDRDRVGISVQIPRGRKINCHHNFTQLEQHDSASVWVTRKGAIKAAVGDLGVIPGSMGTRSYIVEGLGNEVSYTSCSHGAGRVLSRSKAKTMFTEADLAAAMEGKIWLRDRVGSLLDESPGAYKPIDQVMEDQRDLVKPLHTLSQILNYKGT